MEIRRISGNRVGLVNPIQPARKPEDQGDLDEEKRRAAEKLPNPKLASQRRKPRDGLLDELA